MRGNGTAMPIIGQFRRIFIDRRPDPHIVQMPRDYHSRTQSADLPRSHNSIGNDGRRASSEAEQSQLHDSMAEAQHYTNKSIRALEALVRNQACKIEEQQSQYKELDAEVQTLHRENHHLRKQLNSALGRYNHVLQKAVLPYAELRGLNWKSDNPETMAKVLGPLFDDAKEGSDLRGQVTALQNEMFAKRDKVEVVPDNVFEQEFRSLATFIKNISRMVRPLQGVDISQVTASPGLLCGVNQKPWETRTRRKYLIEAWIWSILCECVFAKPFDWLGHDGSDVAGMWVRIFGDGESHDWPSPSTLCETWRATTTVRLSGLLTSTDMSGDSLEFDRPLSCADLKVQEYRSDVHAIIRSFITAISGLEDVPQILTVVDKAFAFALKMSLQRNRLRVTYPAVGSVYDDDNMKIMEDPDDDDDSTENGIVTFVLNPGLTKWGDAYGKNLDQHCDIVKSTVKLERIGRREGISLI